MARTKTQRGLIGMDKLRAKLAAATEVIIEGAKEGVLEGAEALEAGAKADAPRDDGLLIDGISIKYHNNGLSADVAERDPRRTHIAEFQENGTESIPARPFMLPNAKRQRRLLPGRIEKAVATRLEKL